MSKEEKSTIEIPHVIELDYPVEWGKEEEARTEVTVIRRLKAKDYKGMKPNDIRFGDMFKLASKITGEPISFIEELDSVDLFKVVEVVNSFLGVSQETGET